jgi:hypothetical protein
VSEDGTVQETDEIVALYRGAPEDFVTARDALVKRLKAEGDGPGAAAVKARRRPTVAAWALNRLADREPQLLDEVLAAGAELRAAQRTALSSGGGGERLREATAARRAAVRRAAEAATTVLAHAGRAADPQMDDILRTLEAASVDDGLGARMRAGTLERAAADAGGFGEGAGLSLIPGEALESPAEPPAKPRRASDRKRDRAAAAELERARSAEAEAASAARATASEVQRLEAEAERLRTLLDDARSEARKADRRRLEAARSRRAAEAIARGSTTITP